MDCPRGLRQISTTLDAKEIKINWRKRRGTVACKGFLPLKKPDELINCGLLQNKVLLVNVYVSVIILNHYSSDTNE